MAEPLLWSRDGPQWPNHGCSRFVDAAGLRWHVQRAGPAVAAAAATANAPGAPGRPATLAPPSVLLLHGTGASTHSWGGVLPLLARQLDTVAVDLPGHAFTRPQPAAQRPDLSLPGMAAALGALLRQLDVQPTLIVGHSAGAAIAVRMALDGRAAPAAIVSVNGALLPLHGVAGQLFSPLAKLLALNPLVPRLFAWQAADPRVLRRLIDGTGSTLDASGLALYRRLVADPQHVAGALGMMAQWQLQPLADALPRLGVPLHLVVASNDRTLPPGQAEQLQRLLPQASCTRLDGLGHLAHEERPDLLAALVLRLAAPPATPVQAAATARA